MRDLIIMRGCPGCGKSTAIKESGLKDYVLSPDDIRLMLRAPEVNENGEYRISQQDNALVFKMLDEMLVHRMENGSPTITDATGKMYKQKFPYYLIWKRRRYYLDCIRSGKELPEIDLQDDIDFVNFIKDKNFNTIIEARKAYIERK